MDPKIPTLKDSQKPQVKVRGLEAGVTLFDRLKQFKKKDLAFILAGLGTLFMAPLAEHFMMSPEGGDATLGAGFGGGKGSGNGNGIFGNGGSVGGYDSVNGQAPGSAIGGGSDVITPLNVRDPSALVMGPGATQQPPTNSVAPATTPPTAPVTRSDSDLKDALAASARGVSAGAHAAKSLLPIPKIALTGSGLHGLGAASGGSSASAGLSPISSNGIASGKANAGGGGLNMVHPAPGYAGVGKRGQSAGGGGLEGLKAAAGNAGEVMNRGAASNALDTAASQAIPAGGANFSGSGQGGAGTGDKPDSGNQGKDSKSTGDSLEFMKQKAMQEAKIALWAKEQEAGDSKLEMLKIKNTAMETFATEMVKGASAKVSACLFKGFKNKDCMGSPSGVSRYSCPVAVAGGKMTTLDLSADQVGTGIGDCPGSGTANKDNTALYWTTDGTNLIPCGQNTPLAGTCSSDGDPKKPGANTAKDGAGSVGDKPGTGLGGVPASDIAGLQNLAAACTSLEKIRTNANGALDGMKAVDAKNEAKVKWQGIKDYSDGVYAQAAKIAATRDILSKDRTNECGAQALLPDLKKPVIKDQNEVVDALSGDKGAAAAMIGAVSKNDAGNVPYDAIKTAETALANARKTLDKVSSDSTVKIDETKLTGEVPTADIANVYAGTPGGNAEATKLLGAIQQIRKADESLVTMKKTVTQVQKDLETQVPSLRKAAGNAKDDNGGTVVQITKGNAAYEKDLINHPAAGDFADSLTKPDAPDYKAMNQKDAKPMTGDVSEKIKTASKLEGRAKSSLDGYKDAKTPEERLKMKPTVKDDIDVAKSSLGHAWQAQAGSLNKIDGAIAADGKALSGAGQAPQ